MKHVLFMSIVLSSLLIVSALGGCLKTMEPVQMNESSPAAVSDETNSSASGDSKAAQNDVSEGNSILDLDGNTQLLQAAKAGDIARVEALAQKGADVNQALFNGRTPLILAIMKGHSELAGWLIQHGADVNLGDAHFKTPLMYALDFGNDDIAKALVEAGADVNARDEWFRTPAMFIRSNNMLEYMANAKARFLDKDINKKTAVHYIVESAFGPNKDFHFLKRYTLGGVSSDNQGNMPAIYAQSVEMVRNTFDWRSTVYTEPDRNGVNGLMKICGPQTMKVYVDLYNLKERTDKALEEYVKAEVEKSGAKFLNIDKSKGFDIDDKLTVMVSPNTEVVDFISSQLNYFVDKNGTTSLQVVINSRDSIGRTPLMYAANAGNPDAFRILLGRGADPKAKTEGNISVLLVAASTLPEVVDDLIKAGADVNLKKRSSGEGPLQFAVRGGHVDAVKSLIAAGARVNDADEDGYTALHDACKAGNVEIVKLLLNAKANTDVLSNYENNRSPLMLAAYHGYTEIVDLLLKAGAKADLKNGKGETALMMATKADIANMLLKAGASAKVVSKDRKTPLMHRYQSNDFLSVMLTGSDQIINPDAEITKILIAAGADVNAADKNGMTPLMMASDGGDIESVKTLIAAGANVNAINEYGSSALMNAKNAEIIKTLIDAGANVNISNNYKDTPLHHAVYINADAVKALLAAGADVNAKNEYGNTPIANLSQISDLDLFKALVDAGADIQSLKDSESSLISRADSPEVIDYFISKGENINPAEGSTPLHHAAEFSSPVVVQKLLSLGANVNALDEDGRTPLMGAAKWNKLEMVNLLLKAGADAKIVSSSSATKNGGMIVLQVNDGADLAELLNAANAPSDDGYSALHTAVCTSKYERDRQYTTAAVVKSLIAAGVDVNAKTAGGQSALNCALKNGDIEAARVLVLAGAVPENPMLLLQNACTWGDVEFALALAKFDTEKGAEVIDHDPPLIIAAHWKHADLVEALLEAGYNPNVKNKNGDDWIDYVDRTSQCYMLIMKARANKSSKAN